MEAIRKGARLEVRREGRERFRSESAFWYALRNVLRAKGMDVIKKEMSKDGHLVSERVYYVRSRNPSRPDSVYIWDDLYQVRSVAQVFNEKGFVALSVAKSAERRHA